MNFQRNYPLGEAYGGIKARASRVLAKSLGYPELITFNETDRSVTFSTERLIPVAAAKRPRVMLLFSNPHPHFICQGMFLSPNTRGRENLFWPVMEDAGWLPIAKENRTPEQLVEICLNATYLGPFGFIFYCYYAFPTGLPEDIRKIFGKSYFNQVIEPEASGEFQATIEAASVEAVVVFNKGIFNIAICSPGQGFPYRNWQVEGSSEEADSEWSCQVSWIRDARGVRRERVKITGTI
jgi:hypothetical protein